MCENRHLPDDLRELPRVVDLCDEQYLRINGQCIPAHTSLDGFRFSTDSEGWKVLTVQFVLQDWGPDPTEVLIPTEHLASE